MDLELLQKIHNLLAANCACSLLTVTASHGSAPGRLGFKMLVGADGSLSGTIGGGIMEFELVERARSLLAEEQRLGLSFTRLHNRHAAPEQRSGMICSGGQQIALHCLYPKQAPAFEAQIQAASQPQPAQTWLKLDPQGCHFVKQAPPGPEPLAPQLRDSDQPNWSYWEPLQQRDTLYIVGGGHVGLALSRAMLPLDFQIQLFDDRPQLPTFEENHYAHHKKIIDYAHIDQQVQAGANAYAVIVTTAFASDALALARLLPLDWKYIGLMGSATKIAKIRAELLKQGLAPERWRQLRAPIGLPLPNRTPAEIAISIAAEIIQVRNHTRS